MLPVLHRVTPMGAARGWPRLARVLRQGLARAAAGGLSAVWVVWLAVGMAMSAPAQGQRAPAGLLAVPPLSARVVDTTGTLSPAQQGSLAGQLADLEKRRGSQVVVLMVSSTQPEDIAAFAWRVADQWKIGRRQVGDGVLVVVALQDRAMRIEVARALEGAIPDLAARQIIDQAMVPAFRQGDFAGGLGRAIALLDARIGGEGLPTPASQGQGPGPGGVGLDELGIFFLLVVPVAGSVLSSLLGRKLGSGLTGLGAGLWVWWLTTSVLLGGLAGVVSVVLVAALGGGGRGGGTGGTGGTGGWGGWGGGRGGGGGGGGFSSGGGGSFGGGGSSGKW